MKSGDLVRWVAMDWYGVVLFPGDEYVPVDIMFPEGHYEVELHLLEVINGTKD